MRIFFATLLLVVATNAALANNGATREVLLQSEDKNGFKHQIIIIRDEKRKTTCYLASQPFSSDRATMSCVKD